MCCFKAYPDCYYPFSENSIQELTGQDVIPPDVDIVVPVGAGLFVVEAEGVEEFMYDGAFIVAGFAQGELLAILHVSNH